MTAYRDVLFTPIDLPPMPLDLERIKKFRHQQPHDETFGDRFFRTVFLRGSPSTPTNSAYHLYDDQLDWQWTDTAIRYFPEVIDHISSLPFNLITAVSFVGAKNNKPMPPHYDYPPHQIPNFAKENEPYSYRVSIGDTTDAFYVSTSQGTNEQELLNGRYLFGNLPNDTNYWCMTCSQSMHATLPREGKETLFIGGILDIEAHNELVNRSIKKYQNYIITKQMLEQQGRPLNEIISTPWDGLKDRHPELYDVKLRW